MRCPECGSYNVYSKQVLNRPDIPFNCYYRKRKCADCGCVFPTYEITEDLIEVLKNESRKVPVRC